MKKKKITELLDQYQKEQDLYEEFRVFCEQEIRTFLTDNNIWIQSIHGRLKTRDRLQEKLQKLSFNDLHHVRDLVGVRAVFYVDHEIRKFFECLGFADNIGRLRINDRKEHFRSPGFHGIYLILGLDPELSGTELSKFKSLLCEFQVSNVFQHAWSEVYHTTIYSQKEKLSSFAQDELHKIESRFKKTIEGSLKDASDAIHYLYEAAGKLATGASLVTEESFNQLLSATNLNELHERLSELSGYINKHSHRVPSSWKAFDILDALLESSKKMTVEPLKIGSWELKGHDRNDVVRKVFEIAGSLAYAFPDEYFNLTLKLWVEEAGMRREATSGIRNVAEFDLNILKQVGYHYQTRLLDWVENLISTCKWDYAEFLVPILEKLLGLQVEGTSLVGPKSISVTTGAAIVNEDLITLRGRALALLVRAFTESTDLDFQLRIIREIFSSLHLPYLRSKPPDSLKNLLTEESKTVAATFEALITGMSFPVMFTLQHELEKLQDWHAKAGMSVEHLSNILKQHFQGEDFIEKRRFIGSILTHHGSYSGFKRQLDDRAMYAANLAKAISVENQPSWKTKTIEVARMHPALDYGQFAAFEAFLTELSNSQIELAIELLEQNFADLGVFASFLLGKVWRDEIKSRTERIVRTHLEREMFVAEIVRGLAFHKDVPYSLVQELLRLSKKTEDIESVTILAERFVRSTTVSPEDETLFIEAIRFLTERDSFHWVQRIYLDSSQLFNQMSRQHVEDLLGLLVPCYQIEYHCERILLATVERNADIVLDFFLARLRYARGKEMFDHYSAIPHGVHELRAALQNVDPLQLGRFIENVRSLAETERWTALELIVSLLDISTPAVEQLLDECIGTGKSDDRDFAMSLLGRYKNTSGRQRYYRALIEKYPKDRELFRDIASNLLFVEFSTGEDGRLLQLEAFRSNIQEWDSQDSAAIKSFKGFFNDFASTEIEREKARIARERTKETLNFEDNLKPED